MISSTTNSHMTIFMCTFLVCCYCYSCSAKDTITRGDNISDGHGYLESEGMKFQMGFFSHRIPYQVRRFVGIWYTMDPKTVVWVANRDTPVLDSTGFLTVAEDGNIKVKNSNQTAVYFSTNIEGAPQTTLKLYDNGNAVLINVATKSVLWQSFDVPTDTFLPGMKMDINMNLTSRESASDPGSGSFEFHLEPDTANRYSILKAPTTYIWKNSKTTNSFNDNQLSSSVFNLLSNATTQINSSSRNGNVSYNTISMVEPYSRLVMGHLGKLQYFKWSKIESHWVLEWEEPKDACSVYKVCGSFGMCTGNNNSLQCSCLTGFEPITPDKPTDGCKRTSNFFDRSNDDTFINIPMVNMDDTTLPFIGANNESTCIKKCLEHSDCLAYSYSSQKDSRGIEEPSDEYTPGCWFWDTEPNNLRGEGTHNISFRVSESSVGTLSGSELAAYSIY